MSDLVIKLRKVTALVKLNRDIVLKTVDNVSLEMMAGMSYAIVGKSGSGKTSLVSILGLLNTDFQGEYYYKGTSIQSLSDKGLSTLRSKEIGFVFQNYSLIKHLKVWENIELPLLYSGEKYSYQERQVFIDALLQEVQLLEKKNSYPSELSGGEQQRVAIARALAISPEVLICDEPTGALDTQTAQQIMSLLRKLSKTHKTMLILVTHDLELAGSCDMWIEMQQGAIISVTNHL